MSRFVLVKLAVAVALVCGLAGKPSAQLSGLLSGETPAPKAIDPDHEAMLKVAAKEFPRLGSEFTIVAPNSKTYNGFSHALGQTNRWINPEFGTAEDPLSKIDQLFREYGFTRASGKNSLLQSGVKKIVVYGKLKPDGDLEVITAAAVQTALGGYTSKVGSMAAIGFAKAEQLCGPTYGAIIAVYEKSDRGPAAAQFPGLGVEFKVYDPNPKGFGPFSYSLDLGQFPAEVR